MTDVRPIAYRLSLAACAGALLPAFACGSVDTPNVDPGAVFAARASRSSTIAISEDDARVAMVNPEDGSVSVFQTSDNARISRTPTGGAPSAVVFSPDGKTAYVANRADGTIVALAGVDGAAPSIAATVSVGAEPTGLALSPSGGQLFVAEFADSRVSVIDTRTMAIVKTVAVDRPRALLVTNDGDREDADEQLVVAQFFGVPRAGGEAKDDGRDGVIARFALADLAAGKSITLAPFDSGFRQDGAADKPSLLTSPNQLGALAVSAGKLYVTSVSASPAGPARYDNNVFPVVYVADLATGAERRDAAGTANLARKIYDAQPTATPANPRFIPGDLSDLAFLGDTNIAYAVGRAADVMVRLSYGTGLTVGSTQNTTIDLGGNDTIGRCQGPTGVATAPTLGRAYVNCWVTRRLGVVELDRQQLTQTAESAAVPTGATEQSIQRGLRFYFTGRGRWSKNVGNGAKGGEGWSSCGSCHPDGLTDNITWIFAAGPRQTTSMDGTFSHGPGAQKMRVLNWSAVNDELHDFEPNTRDVSGGIGVITTAAQLADCNQLDKEQQVSPLTAGINAPLKELADNANVAICRHKEWDDIDLFTRTIAPVRASKLADPQAVTRGRQVFVDGGCANCHGGSGWTVSRRFYTPTGPVLDGLALADLARPAFFPSTFMYDNGAVARKQASGQPAITADATGPAEAAIGVKQVACALRNVGTFGVLGNAGATDALEIRAVPGTLSLPAGQAPLRAQGRGGYNVPSLYGLALGAPYLHHGQAKDLRELFSDARFDFHTNAGNANFKAALAQGTKLADLTSFLVSIDASTPEFALATDRASGASFDVCPAN